MNEFLPLDLVFSPNWWYHAADISFDRAFYLDSGTRIRNDVTMRKVLHQRFGTIGLGEPDPQPRPVVGSLHVAGGFIIPALLGAEIRFAAGAAPQPVPKKLSPEKLELLKKPDFYRAWPMKTLISQMDLLEKDCGYLVGDFDLDGLLNTAYLFYGQELYTDFYHDPDNVVHILEIIAQLMLEVGHYVRQRTGSCAISTNRMVSHVAPELFLHSNCSVQMISPRSYQQIVLPLEKWMADRIQPYGIHHCGNNMQRYAPYYARVNASFYDVGWGSDVAECRRHLPGAFLNLRLSPIRMLQCTPGEIAQDTEQLLLSAGPLNQAGVCCINMDAGTPDDNIFAMAEVVQRYRGYGA